MVFVGLDLQKRYITGCALSAEGMLLDQVGRLSPTWDALSRWLGTLGEELTVVLEATLYCWWLERRVTAAGHRALAVDAYQVKLIWQTRTKTDPIDARKLAELARIGNATGAMRFFGSAGVISAWQGRYRLAVGGDRFRSRRHHLGHDRPRRGSGPFTHRGHAALWPDLRSMRYQWPGVATRGPIVIW